MQCVCVASMRRKTQQVQKIGPWGRFKKHYLRLFIYYFVHFVVQKVISPIGNLGRFQGKPAATTLINYKVHAGSFHVSKIHRTLTWTTGSLTCLCGHSYACIYTQGCGTPTASQNNIFDLESRVFLVLLMQTVFEPQVFRSRIRRSAN